MLCDLYLVSPFCPQLQLFMRNSLDLDRVIHINRSLLLLLYGRFLRTIPSSTIHNATSDVQILKAIAGINFTVRIINDTTTDLNDHLARRPDLLAPCSPVTPYSAYYCLRVLSDFEHVIPNADARFHDIYSSLHFFAKRWGVAGEETSMLVPL